MSEDRKGVWQENIQVILAKKKSLGILLDSWCKLTAAANHTIEMF